MVDTPFVWGAGGAQMTPDQIAAARKVAEAMMMRGADYSPVQHWTQGLARAAEGIVGGLRARAADQAAQENATAESQLLTSLATPGAPTNIVPPTGAAPANTPAAPSSTGQAGAAIAGIESGGAYDKLGPVTKTGDRAYGKYQVMGANIPQWTKTHLGREMTAEQFLASPEAQDAVFNGQFGIYSQKYGPEGAAKAWFAGEKGMNNPNAKDQLGTTVSAYADKFSKNMGLPYQVAGPAVAAPAAAEPTATANLSSASPAAATVAQAAAASPGVNPRLLSAMASPYVSDGAKKVLGIMLQNQLQGEGVTPVDAGNKIIVMDKRGNVVREMAKGEPNKGPEYGVIGKDQFGNEQYGWRDPRSQTVTPFNPQGAAAGQPVTVPGPDGKPIAVPANADPKVYREAASKAGVANSLPATFEDTAKLRHEVTQLPSYKNLSQAAPIYQAMHEAAGRNTKAADLNLVYGLGKIMDPGSVVREGEIQMANNAQGWQEKLNGIIAQINGQGGLTPEGRQALMAEAYGRINSYKAEFDRDAARYKGITERNRMNTADVIPEFGAFEPWMVPKAAATTPAIDDLVKKYGGK